MGNVSLDDIIDLDLLGERNDVVSIDVCDGTRVDLENIAWTIASNIRAIASCLVLDAFQQDLFDIKIGKGMPDGFAVVVSGKTGVKSLVFLAFGLCYELSVVNPL